MNMIETDEKLEIPAYDHRWRERANGQFQAGTEDNRWWRAYWRYRAVYGDPFNGKPRLGRSSDQQEG